MQVQHEPGVWVRAHVENECRQQGRWRLSCYYFVGNLQCYRVYDADQVWREGSASELQDDERSDPPTGQVPPQGGYDSRQPILLRDALHVASPA